MTACKDSLLTENDPPAVRPLPIAPASRPATRNETGYLQRMVESLETAERAVGKARQFERAKQTGRSMACGDRSSLKKALALSVVMPVYNECDTIREIVARIRAVGVHREIIIVDDFSIDGTRKILLEMADSPDIRVLWHGYNRGKGASLRTAFQHVRGEIVLIQDADLEYNPADNPQLLAPLERGEADVVYGSRFLAKPRQTPPRLHRFGNWLLTAASNLTTGQRLTDMETCYKVFRREVLDRIELKQNRFGFEPELTAKISQLGYRIHEVPIGYRSRSYQEGKKIGPLDGFQALWCIARYGS